jgi:STE24 endopeptidase
MLLLLCFTAVIAPLFNKFDPLPDGSLRSKIEALAGSLKFPLKKLYQMDGSKRSAHSNAYM